MWKLMNRSASSEYEEQPEDNLLDDTEGLCSLSPLQRLYGFAACLAAGLICMLLEYVRLCYGMGTRKDALGYKGNIDAFCEIINQHFTFLALLQSLIVFVKPIKFALLFTFGNVLAIGSTAFLIGPRQQLRMMLDPVRVYATAIYAGCVLLALICALLVHSKILTLVAIICEICALIWYSLSYIPFARRVVSDMTIRLFDTEI